MFKVVLEVPKPLLMFLNSCLFILFWLNVYFSLLVQTVDLSPGFLPIPVGSLYIFLYFILHILYFSLSLQPYSTISVSILITSVLNCASDRLPISSSLSCIFFWNFDLFFIWAIFFILARMLCSKGWSLRYSPGQGNPLHCVVTLYVGEGSEREQCCLLGSCQLSVTSPTTHKGIVPSQVLPL